MLTFWEEVMSTREDDPFWRKATRKKKRNPHSLGVRWMGLPISLEASAPDRCREAGVPE